jgi:magnesium transporter
MIEIFITENGAVKQIEKPQPGCWIYIVNPDEKETSAVASEFHIDTESLRAALDEEEISRIEVGDDYTMVLVNIPTYKNRDKEQWYCTIPLSIIILNDALITVCLEDTPILDAFIHERVRDFRTHMKTRFIFQILYRISSLYLQYLHSIDKKSGIVEEKLQSSTKNRELIELLKLEKSLVFFTTALRSNEIVLEKMLRSESIKKFPEDTELLEDVIIENKQAIEMTNIYSGILSGMMDAFASVISNNLNIVMKFLAIVTIIMSIPTMIFSAYGMNIAAGSMPFANNPYGFIIIIALSLILSLIVTVILAKIKIF